MFKYLYYFNLFAFSLQCLIIPLYLYGFLSPFREVLISIFAVVIVLNMLRVFARSKHKSKMVIAANAYPFSVIIASVFCIVALVLSSKVAMILSLCSSFIVGELVIVALAAVKIYLDIAKLNISKILGLIFACIMAFASSAIGTIFAFLNDLVFNPSSFIADSIKQKVLAFTLVLTLAISSLTINNTFLHISFIIFMSIYFLLISISSAKRIRAVKSNMKVSDVHTYDFPELIRCEARNSFEFLLGSDLVDKIFIPKVISDVPPMQNISEYLNGLSDDEKDEIRILKMEEVEGLQNSEIKEIYESSVSSTVLNLPIRDANIKAHYCLNDLDKSIEHNVNKIYLNEITGLADVDIGFHEEYAEIVFRHIDPSNHKERTYRYMKMCEQHKDNLMGKSILDRI